jgi:hypothetical protein
MKNLKKKEVWQVRTNFLEINSWIKIKTKKKDLKCSECGVIYADLLYSGVGKIALMTIKGEMNVHLCNNCGKRYIDELGAVDIEAQIIARQKEKDIVFEKIKATGADIKEDWNKKEIPELETILSCILKKQEKQVKLDSIEFTEEELAVEDYLIKEYGVVSSSEWLKSENQIEAYFRDCYSDFFDCGQGYYEDEVDIIVKIGPKFFNVHLVVEIGSAKQDRGDRLYWTECFKSCKWEEIEKPAKKETKKVSYSFELNESQETKLNKFLKENDIK